MAAFAASLPTMAGAGGNFENKLVVDQTGLEGGWTFSFHFTPRVAGRAPVAGVDIPLFDALEQQVGLTLKTANVPLPVVVVDSVKREPDSNARDIKSPSPSSPTEFEVASVKPSPPVSGSYRVEIKNGRVNLSGVSVRALIGLGWRIYNDDLLAGAPKWLNEDRFDIVAKAPAGVAIGESSSGAASLVNLDAIRPMIRALVNERFKLESHSEERLRDVRILTAAKPKLMRADPAGRTRCAQVASPAANTSRNSSLPLGRVFRCTNITMAEFAETLHSIAPLYIKTDVVDSTGLEGRWDFTFGFSSTFEVQAAVAAAGSASNPEASEPNRAMSLFDAVNKQLGLRLDQTEKRPGQVLVIDHIERKPIEN